MTLHKHIYYYSTVAEWYPINLAKIVHYSFIFQ